MKKKESLSIKEMIEQAKKEPQINIEFLNEPNMKLMAEAAINLYHQTY